MRRKGESVLQRSKRQSQPSTPNEAGSVTHSVDLGQSLATRFKLVESLLKLGDELGCPFSLPQVRPRSEVFGGPYGRSGDLLREVLVWLDELWYGFQLSRGELFSE